MHPLRVLRQGKRECLWQESPDLPGMGGADNAAHAPRRVYRLAERTIDKHGGVLLLPFYALAGWTTTLPHGFTEQEIIALHCQHATHELFHSEFKSDMGLERLPAGKFDTNYLVCALAAVAMNLLHLIGQHTPNEPDAPLRCLRAITDTSEAADAHRVYAPQPKKPHLPNTGQRQRGADGCANPSKRTALRTANNPMRRHGAQRPRRRRARA